MMHMVGNNSSLANGTALLQVTGLSDVMLQVRDNAIIVPSKPFALKKVLSIFAFSADLNRAQLQPPFMRAIGNYEIRPVSTAAAAAGSIPGHVYLDEEPFEVVEGEELPVFAIQGNVGAQRVTVGVLLSDKKPMQSEKESFTIRLTGTTTLVASAWTQAPLTFDLGLPKGDYGVVGARVESATGVLFRFIHTNDISRPGG